ncbi:MAG TPA: hypothetical protein ENK84_00075 [Desulfobulbus sp.]|nr:hypothetical protein [Desulfobulbus sp.]
MERVDCVTYQNYMNTQFPESKNDAKSTHSAVTLAGVTPDHPKAKESAKISEFLSRNSIIYDLA